MNKFNILYENIINELIKETTKYKHNIYQSAKYIEYKNSNFPAIRLQDGTICTIIYNSYPIKDLIKRYFDAVYLPNLKAWRVEEKIDKAYPRLLDLMKQNNLVKTNSNNAKFIQNTYLQNYEITFVNIKQQFGIYGKYLILTGTNNQNINFILNSSQLTKNFFQKLYSLQLTNPTVLQNIKINFNGNIVSNDYQSAVLINKVIINNQTQILNTINTLINNLPKKKFLIDIKIVRSSNKYFSEIIEATTVQQAKLIIYKKYPKGFIESIKEI